MGLALIHTAAALAGDVTSLPDAKQKIKAEAIRQIGISHVVRLAHKYRKVHHRHIAAEPKPCSDHDNRCFQHAQAKHGIHCGEDRAERCAIRDGDGPDIFDPWQPKPWPYDSPFPVGLPKPEEGPLTVYEAVQRKAAEVVQRRPMEELVGTVLDVSA